MVHQRIVAADAAAMAGLAAEWLADETRLCTVLRGECALCLAGGTTPRPAYEALAEPALASSIPWDRVQVFFGDERAVPPDHPESNFRMVRWPRARSSRPCAGVPARPTAAGPSSSWFGDLDSEPALDRLVAGFVAAPRVRVAF